MTAVLDRRPARCTAHTIRKQAGCTLCRACDAWGKRDRRRRRDAGIPASFCPVGEASAHLRQLTDIHGWTCLQIAARSGLSVDDIRAIRRGERSRGVHPVTHAAIVGVRLGPPPSSRLVPATGTHRRIRALCRHGWTFAAIAARFGLTGQALASILARDTVTAATHTRIAAAYREMAVTPGPSPIARTRAAAPRPDHPRGWPGPMCWTPETIDDPAAAPDWGDAPTAFRRSLCRTADNGRPCPLLQLRDRRRRLDPAAVEQCLLGTRRADQLSTAERIEVVTRLARRGMTDTEIAARTRWPTQATTTAAEIVNAFRANHRIPAGVARSGWAA